MTSRAIGVAALAVALTGCAFSDVELEFPSAVDHPRPVGRQREIVLRGPFADRRPDPTRCGIQKNGYNTETAEALCPSAPGAWLGWLLASELRAAGFRVVDPARVRSADPLVIDGELQQLFVEPVLKAFWVTLEADIGVRLVAQTRSGLAASRTFYVKGSDSAMAASESTFQAALDDASTQIIHEMVASIGSLMDRYPGMGYPHVAQLAPAGAPHP